MGYEYIPTKWDNTKYTNESQFKFIQDQGFDTPIFKVFPNNLVTELTLPDILANYRELSPYEIDGIVVGQIS